VQLKVAPINHFTMEKLNNKNTVIQVEINEIPKMTFRIFSILIFTIILPFVVLHSDMLSLIIDDLSAIFRESFFLYLFRLMWVALVFILVVILGIVLHEAIHALFFSFFLPSKFRGVEFGFNKDHGIPFVHIKEPISVLGFRIGAIMPLIILGILPAALGLYSGYLSLTAFGVLFTISASGDLLLITRTRSLPSTQKIKDLPDKIGFELV